MEFNFKNYNLFCYDFNLIPSRYKNLKILILRGDDNEIKFA